MKINQPTEGKSSNTSIRRMDMKQGSYSYMSNQIMRNEKLTPEAIMLLFYILNNSELWNLSLTYYRKRFGWSERTQSAVIKNLTENGYLMRVKKGLGKDKGF